MTLNTEKKEIVTEKIESIETGKVYIFPFNFQDSGDYAFDTLMSRVFERIIHGD